MLRRVLLVIAYALSGAAIIAATFILVAIGEGYSYDFRTNQFVLNGLLVLSTPYQSGTVYINGRSVHRQTPYRTTLQAGDYDLEIRRPGYKTWQKHVVVRPSEVTDYPQIMLLPDSFKSEVATQAQSATAIFASSNHKHIAYMTSGADPGVWVLNVGQHQGTKVFTPVPATPEVPAMTLVSAAWSADGSHLLVTAKVGETNNYLVVPSGGGNAINLTDIFKFDFSGLQFSSYDWRELFWLSPEGLRKLNIDSKTVSAPLADKVASFTYAGDRVVYVQSTQLGKAIYSMDRNGNQVKRLVESVAESDSYDLAYSSFRGRDLLAVVPRQTATATLYLDIYGSTPTSVVVSKNASNVTFSFDGRYMAYYSTNNFGSYDIDRAQLSVASRNLAPIQSLMWLDNFHVLINTHDNAAVAEADGDNVTTFASVLPVTPVVAAGNQRQAIVFQDKGNVPSRLVLFDLRP